MAEGASGGTRTHTGPFLWAPRHCPRWEEWPSQPGAEHVPLPSTLSSHPLASSDSDRTESVGHMPGPRMDALEPDYTPARYRGPGTPHPRIPRGPGRCPHNSTQVLTAAPGAQSLLQPWDMPPPPHTSLGCRRPRAAPWPALKEHGGCWGKRSKTIRTWRREPRARPRVPGQVSRDASREGSSG